MSILVYYNLNHHYFRCDHTDKIATLSYKKGKIDAFNRLYIQNINFKNNQLFIKPRISTPNLKILLGDYLVRKGNKLSGNQVQSHKNKYPWWLKK